MFSAAAVVLVASTIVGQADQISPIHKELEAYRPLIGTWSGEAPVLQAVPGIAEKGDVVRFVLSIQWARHGNGIVVDLDAKLGDKAIPFTYGFIVWDAQKRKLVGTDSYVDGGVYHYEVTPSDGMLTYKGQGCKADGTPTSSTITMKIIDENHWESQFINQTEGGAKVPDGPVITLKRVKP